LLARLAPRLSDKQDRQLGRNGCESAARSRWMARVAKPRRALLKIKDQASFSPDYAVKRNSASRPSGSV
jgi:hypothetical protein